MKRIICGSMAAAFVGIFMLSNALPAMAAQTLRLSMDVNQQSPWYAGAKRFAKLIAKDSDGRYEVKIFPNAQLFMGNDQSEITGVINGTVALELKDGIWMSSMNPKFAAPALPFLFPNHAVAMKVLDGQAGDKLMSLLGAKYGLVGLAWGVNGFRQLTSNTGPITSPADVKGMSIRVPGAHVMLDTWKALDAAPTAMPFSAVFTALQTGAIDAQENPYSLIWANHFYEVQKYVTQLNYIYAPLMFMMNKAAWNKLSPADQKMFRHDAKSAMNYERCIVIKQDTTIPPKLKSHGMTVTVLSSKQLKAWREATKPVYKDMQKAMGSKLINLFVKKTKKAEKTLGANGKYLDCQKLL